MGKWDGEPEVRINRVKAEKETTNAEGGVGLERKAFRIKGKSYEETALKTNLLEKEKQEGIDERRETIKERGEEGDRRHKRREKQ